MSSPKAGTSSGSGSPDVYIVEAIRQKRVRKGKPQYLVKWVGYEEKCNTWEPAEHFISPVMIRQFEEQRKDPKAKKRRTITHTSETGDDIQDGVETYYMEEVESYNGVVEGAYDESLVPQEQKGFKRGLEPEKVLSGGRTAGQLMFLMKWKGAAEHDTEIVLASEARENCPQLVIDFYQEHFPIL